MAQGEKKVRFDEVKSGTFSKKVYLSWSKRTEKMDTSDDFPPIFVQNLNGK